MDDLNKESKASAWRFFRNGPGSEGPNSILVGSDESPVGTAVRELCQNVNDARDDQGKPAYVEFTLRKMKKDLIPDFDNYKEAIMESREACNSYTYNKEYAEAFDRMIEELKNDEISVLTVSDYNTVGLDGAGTKSDTASWNRLTVTVGISDKPEGSGGSKGVGKTTYYGISVLKTIFIETLNKKGERAFTGRCIFMPRDEKHGDAIDKINSLGIYAHDYVGYEPLMDESEFPAGIKTSRAEPGTDITILGYTDAGDDWEKPIVSEVVKDFVVAIMDDKFKAKVGSTVIDKNTISNIVDGLVHDRDLNDPLISVLPDIIRAYSNSPIFSSEDFDIYLEKSDQNGRVITTKEMSGMTVESGFKNNQRCSGVVVAKGEAANLLSKCENPTHSHWDYRSVTDKGRKKQIENLLQKMKRELNKAVKEFMHDDSEVLSATGLSNVFKNDRSVKGKEETQGGTTSPEIKIRDVPTRRPGKQKGSSSDGSHGGEAEGGGAAVPEGDGSHDELSPVPPDPPKPEKPRKSFIDPNPGPVPAKRPDGRETKIFEQGEGESSTVRSISEEKNYRVGKRKYAVEFKVKKSGEVKMIVTSLFNTGEEGDIIPILNATDSSGNKVAVKDDSIIGPVKVTGESINRIVFETDFPGPFSFRMKVVE